MEIVAQPPGKKLQSVNLLSGGEKALTAVALIFAIFLIKPTPFCLLDEVDAPLDEANVGRYNEMVREMSKQSQFILITHNKRTMEVVDTLYGVTMEEPGISKLVSVKMQGGGRRQRQRLRGLSAAAAPGPRIAKARSPASGSRAFVASSDCGSGLLACSYLRARLLVRDLARAWASARSFFAVSTCGLRVAPRPRPSAGSLALISCDEGERCCSRQRLLRL